MRNYKRYLFYSQRGVFYNRQLSKLNFRLIYIKNNIIYAKFTIVLRKVLRFDLRSLSSQSVMIFAFLEI